MVALRQKLLVQMIIDYNLNIICNGMAPPPVVPAATQDPDNGPVLLLLSIALPSPLVCFLFPSTFPVFLATSASASRKATLVVNHSSRQFPYGWYDYLFVNSSTCCALLPVKSLTGLCRHCRLVLCSFSDPKAYERVLFRQAIILGRIAYLILIESCCIFLS